jgi:dihydropteroate synthase
MNVSGRHPSLSLLDKSFAVMGVVNVTPDSFSDGGKYAVSSTAVDHGLRLVAEGADILDIGGESTRPGAAPVSIEEESARVLPVIEKLAKSVTVPISIDTTKSAVAKRALDAGAQWINDISAGRFDPEMPVLAAKHHCPVILMHSRKQPKDMQQDPFYKDVITEVKNELLESAALFISQGVKKENIILDPGIGFAKRLEDNVMLLRHIDQLINTGFPLLVGTSRKSFIGLITGKPVNDRLAGTLGSISAAYAKGARFFRVHEVAPVVDMLKVQSEISPNFH